MKLSAAAPPFAGEPNPIASARFRRAAALIGIGLAAFGVVLAIDISHGLHLHAPQLILLLAVPAVLQVHIAAAVLALGIGMALLIGVKGRAFHRVAGWLWAGCMMTVAVSSFWIRDHGQFGLVHLLSGWVSIAVPMALAAARRHNVRLHRTTMTSVFMGGLIVAGAFTFVPGRLMWKIFLG